MVASNASPGTITTETTVFDAGHQTVTSWTVSNPLTNGYNILEFLINAGGAGCAGSGTCGGFASFNLGSCSSSTGSWTASAPTNQEVDFLYVGPTPLTPGSTTTFTCTFTATAQSGAATADTYTQTYLTRDSLGGDGLVNAGTVTLYVAAANAAMTFVKTVYTPAAGMQPAVPNNLIAGTSVFLEYKVTSTGSLGIAGIPVTFTWTSADATYNASGLATLVATGVTSTDGKVNSTFFLDPVIADQVTGAFVTASAGNAANPNGALDMNSLTYLVATAAAPSAIGVKIATGDLNQAQGAVPIPAADITASSTDQYGNPAPAPSDIAVTLATVNVIGATAAFSASAAFPPSSPTVSTGVTILTGHTTVHPTLNLFFATDYGDQSYLTATASGYPTAISKTVTTWGFNFLGNPDLVFLKPTGAKNVAAGGTIVISMKFTIAQNNVPVNFIIVKADSSHKYSGTFSNGANNITVTTDSTGSASATLTVSTLAGAFTQIGVSYPGDYPQVTVTPTTVTGVITTVAGPASVLVFLPAYDHLECVAPANIWCHPLTNGFAVNGTTVYLDLQAQDAYGNPAIISTSSNTQINISPGTGLSSSTVYIFSTADDLIGPPGAGWISWIQASGLNVAQTLTATSTFPSGPVSATLTITTVSASPTLAVTSPAPYNGVIYTRFTTVTFTGQANASVGFAAVGPNKVTITKIGYQLNGGVWKTYTVGVPAWSVSFSFALTATQGKNTIEFNATDSKGDVFSTGAMTLLVDSSAPVIGFTTATGAVINAGTAVTGWAYDTEGDLNASSVTVWANGVALPASDVAVTGTNVLGTNTTYSISVTGLTAGTWTLKMTASNYAGNAATPVSIVVTVEVPQGSTFTTPGAASCTSGGFTGDCVTFTNNAATSETVNVFFVWYNTQGQVVNVGAQLGVTFASGASASFFNAYTTAGSYTVQAFVRDASNNALSQSYQATIVVP